jgi:hypothetical protein
VFEVHNFIVGNALLRGEELTDVDACIKYGTPSLRASVYFLKREGFKITKRKDERGIIHYKLKERPKG